MITEPGGAGANDLFMDPSGPLWPLGIHQTDANREGGRKGGGEGRRGGAEETNLKDGDGGGGGTQMANVEGLTPFSKRQCWNFSHYEMEHACVRACVSWGVSWMWFVNRLCGSGDPRIESIDSIAGAAELGSPGNPFSLNTGLLMK